MTILDKKGKELPEGTLQLVMRWAGWQAVTGTKTVMDIYARKIVDQFLDPYGIINGCCASAEHWERKLKKYLGHPVFPDKPIIDLGHTQVHMQVCVIAWRLHQWLQLQSGLNALGNRIMTAASVDDAVMPMNRYVQRPRAFNLYVAQFPSAPAVLRYKQLLRHRVKFWKACVKSSIKLCRHSCFDMSPVPRPEKLMRKQKFLTYLKSVTIGNVSLDEADVPRHKYNADTVSDRHGAFHWM